MSIRSLTLLLPPRPNVRKRARDLLRRYEAAGYEIRRTRGVTDADVEEFACVQVIVGDRVPSITLTAALGAPTGGEKAAVVAGQRRLLEEALQGAEGTYPRGVELARCGDIKVVPAYREKPFEVISHCP